MSISFIFANWNTAWKWQRPGSEAWMCIMGAIHSTTHAVFPWYKLSVLTSSVSLYLLLMSAEKLKKEIEMQPNRAYETVSRPCPSKSATQIHTERCVAYEDVIVRACN